MANRQACLSAALCSLLIVASFICGSESASCCMRYTRGKIPCKALTGYNIQTINGSCDISAIIFHLGGRFVCADPLKAWTLRAMKCVDEKRRKVERILEERN
ncbi:C-C motif chemokine 20-like [Cyprinodon tularosa]|uniref:C-C motif chemokine 20-like n=1 Tax=Cyprinodon tularosa TaxID=77115 RepID=UPI0018E1EF79|nr:C-C motif chemokine 20-like [Cyprinodon tularosa]XP_038131864.1 C-C motif chemokine 20-like [Cyprinodon tularosa]XP_038131866.1 C-C motif chemokine 20-like [Cyprinodon tularosa]